MYRYGIERWLDSGEMFSVYTGTMATLSPIEVRETDDGRRLGFRPPVVGVTRIPWAPARVAFVAALIGTVTVRRPLGQRLLDDASTSPPPSG